MPAFAHQVVNRCLRITEKDNVTISFYPHSLKLAEEIAVECFKNGADVLLNLYTDRYYRSYLTELSVESLKRPSVFCRALTENSTVKIEMFAAYDPAVFRSIPPEKRNADSEGEQKAHLPLGREKKVRGLTIGVAALTRPRAKAYGFNYHSWSRMIHAAAQVDYERLMKAGRVLKEVLSRSKTLNVIAKDGTNLALDVSGQKWRVSDGVVDDSDIKEENFEDTVPAGSIGTTPIEDGVDGRITFNTVAPYSGYPIKRMTWTFKSGLVSGFEGDSSIKPVKDDWVHAAGDRSRIAYFALGFNPRALPNYTVNSLVSGAVSIGIGGNQFVGGKNNSSFFFLHTLTNATITADGETLAKSGRVIL